jgi:hypothetical protein
MTVTVTGIEHQGRSELRTNPVKGMRELKEKSTQPCGSVLFAEKLIDYGSDGGRGNRRGTGNVTTDDQRLIAKESALSR